MTNAVGKQSPGGFLYYMKLMIDMVKGHCARPSMSKVLYILWPTVFKQIWSDGHLYFPS
jgi:hypothetical protein